ncbi:MAG: hypothetical protein JO316_25850 [Abitibacteriaceae bacterium]|nr:hypothetical protein [Abditibacteriaceae bacterium]MBV9868797.1 hypothetical protein [Abditibacteriaceae bacterium]
MQLKTISGSVLLRVCFLWGLLSSVLLICYAAPKPLTLHAPSAPIHMVAYDDPWPLAAERWWDIASYRDAQQSNYNQYNDWLSYGGSNGKFDYRTRAEGVTLIYDKNPTTHCFVGHITAKGLKPNFAYQLKLTGKPVAGTRGFGTASSYVTATSEAQNGRPVLHTVLDAKGHPTPVNGDDWTNQQLGYAGRWWNDSFPSNNTNAVTDEEYQLNTLDTIYGYIFIGDFVTDKYGNAEWDVVGNRSYHVTWQNWQKNAKHVRLGKFNIAGGVEQEKPEPGKIELGSQTHEGTTHYYGYGLKAPSTDIAQQHGKRTVTLFYEWEWGRLSFVRLPKGTYHCRLLITEETFHNTYANGTSGSLGGTWKTVMSTENFPDNDPANDIVFSIP